MGWPKERNSDYQLQVAPEANGFTSDAIIAIGVTAGNQFFKFGNLPLTRGKQKHQGRKDVFSSSS